ncbi:MAG: NAD(P)H-dependent oxidoreductase subunit E, partial [Sediminibacterium sp.]|nr:NAD(P)H-dependent oxidoreductase subunit E [Sediminibacterium sp.]
IEVCRTSSCWLRGAEDVVKHIEKRLGIKDGETTTDGKFTLKTVECLGACGYAPMLQAGEKFHEHLTEEKVDQLIEMYRNKPVANYMGLENNG